MDDIDLIPSDYRLRRWLARSARRFGLAVMAAVILTGATYAVMQRATDRANAKIEILEQKKETIAGHRTERDQLREQKRLYESQLALLEGLRGGASAEAMLVAIDRALTENDVWFVDWEFRRTGKVVARDAQKKDSGYVVVLSSNGNESDDEAWQIEAQMSIKGQAIDHSALSRFVRRLLSQPEIQEVHVLSSAQRKGRDNRFVEFDLSIDVNPGILNS